MDGSRRESLLVSEQFTLPELIDHMKQGRTVLGTKVQPYPWLEYTGPAKTDMEVKIERYMTSCTFKTVTSCVIGKESRCSSTRAVNDE